MCKVDLILSQLFENSSIFRVIPEHQSMGSSTYSGVGNHPGYNRAFYTNNASSNFVTSGKERPPEHLSSAAVFGETHPAFQSHQPPQNVSIDPITPATVSSFRHIIALLLPIRYPDKFFAESTANVTPSSLARVALWHERSGPAKRKRGEDIQNETGDSSFPDVLPTDRHSLVSTLANDVTDTVVGGIQCRLEQLPCHPSSDATTKNTSSSTENPKKYCYIQTLALLSPYRSRGIGVALIEAIITTLCTEKEYHGTASIYAHVWEANEEALEWYVKRGFQVGGIVPGYYRRLKPAGARIVWRDLGVRDYLQN